MVESQRAESSHNSSATATSAVEEMKLAEGGLEYAYTAQEAMTLFKKGK
jgi:hypothetical protein